MTLLRDIGYGVYVILVCLRWLPSEFLRPQPFGHRRLLEALIDVGARPFATLTLLAALVGAVIGLEGGKALATLHAEIPLVDAVRAVLFREFTPLLVGILLAGRSGVLLTARIGSMNLGEESEAVAVLGSDPLRHAVLPVLAALLLLAPLATVWCSLVALLSIAATIGLNGTLSPQQFLDLMMGGPIQPALLYGLAKSLVFAMLVAALAAINGTKVERDSALLPRLASRTFTQAFVAIIGVNVLFLMLEGAVR